MQTEILQLNTSMKVRKMYRMRPINMAGHLPLLQSGQVLETVDQASNLVQLLLKPHRLWAFTDENLTDDPVRFTAYLRYVRYILYCLREARFQYVQTKVRQLCTEPCCSAPHCSKVI